jgi:hypothetical protein
MTSKSRDLISNVLEPAISCRTNIECIRSGNIMADIKKINSQFDLKNIDAAQLAKILREHQNSLIKLILIIGSMWVVGVMFNDHRIKDQNLLTQMSQVQQKLDAVKARDAAIANFNDFKSSLPKKLNEFELITLISDYAKLNHVNITSLSPAESKDMGLYDIIDAHFDVISDNFKNMILFLRTIEKSNASIRVGSWTGHVVENGKITFSISISAVIIHT